MPLRGTMRKSERNVWNKRQTLQNQITALKAQVSKQKPETQYYLNDVVVSTTDGNDKIQHFSVTGALKDDPTFRNYVTGDRWVNTALHLSSYITSDNMQSRIVVYVPKTPGDRFSPVGDTIFTEFPDPNRFWVLSDKLVDRPDRTGNSGNQAIRQYCNLRGMITEYSSLDDDIHKGEVVITFLVNGSSATGNIQLKNGSKLIFYNK